MDRWINYKIQSLPDLFSGLTTHLHTWRFLKSILDSALSLNIFAIKSQNFLPTPETENCLHLVDKGEKKETRKPASSLGRQREIDMFDFPLINSSSNTQDGSLNIADFGLNNLRSKHKVNYSQHKTTRHFIRTGNDQPRCPRQTRIRAAFVTLVGNDREAAA